MQKRFGMEIIMERKLAAIIISGALIVSLFLDGCTQKPGTGPETEPTDIASAGESSESPALDEETEEVLQNAYLDLAFELINRENEKNTNVLVSPMSIELAMAMAAAGAEGETALQMTDVLGGGAETEAFLAFYQEKSAGLTDTGDDCFHVANSLWLNKDKIGTSVRKDYTDLLDKTFGAQVFREPFDNGTVKDINNWVNTNTREMIPEILDSIPDSAAAYIINALAFQGKWANPYESNQVKEGTFYNENGTELQTDFMCETLDTYYEYELATGFMKEYEGGDYAFLAILPKEELSFDEFVASFDRDAYQSFCDSATNDYEVFTKVPKFEYEFKTQLAPSFQEMGITDAFDPAKADFSGICEEYNNGAPIDLYIDSILHSTYIRMDENGTEAAAVTVIEIRDNAAAPMEIPERKEVILDRPFLYAIVDTSDYTPIFLGSINGL